MGILKKRIVAIFCILLLSVSGFSFTLPAINAQIKANLRSVMKRGTLLNRIVGKMGQWGDSITNSMAYLGSLGSWGCSNATCQSYYPILIWMKASETSPGSGIVGGGGATPLAEKGGGHCCESGWRVETGLGVLDAVIKQDNPSWSLTMYGTNDISGSTWDAARADFFKQRLKFFLQSSIDAGIVPAVSTIPPRRDNCTGTDYSANVATCNGAILEAANELGIPLVDFHAACIEFHPSNWCGTTISGDGVHPSYNSLNFDAPNIQDDGYALRSKLTLDYAQKLKDIVFDNNAPDGADLPILDISSSSHEWGQYSSETTVDFSWALDGGSTPTEYSYVFDQIDSTTPDQTSEGTGTTASVSATQTGDWFFHVRANSALGWGPVSHYLVRIIPQNQIILQDGFDGYSGTQDASIWASYDMSNGSDAIMQKYNGGSTDQRILFKFSLAPLAGYTISNATFEVFTDNPGDRDSLTIFALDSSWDEGISGYQQTWGVTWSYRSGTDTANMRWNTPGGDYNATAPLGHYVLPSDGTPTWASFDITPSVQAWLADSSTNNGMIMTGYRAWVTTQFFAHEFPLKNLCPRLVVTYSGTTTEEALAQSKGIVVGQPKPNPANPSVTIPISLAKGISASVSIYAVNGKLVNRQLLQAGNPRIVQVTWSGRLANGGYAASGLYLVKVAIRDGISVTKRFVLAQ